VLLAQADKRVLEARLSYGDARRWRPYEVSRSSDVRVAEPVSLKALATLEEQRDLHGLAVGHLLRGERGEAADFLKQAGDSADIDSDRAVVALSRGALEEALILLAGVLEKQPGHPQALWNRGLVLRELGLEMLAAEAFQQVAAKGEAGWSEEARERAQSLLRNPEERARAYQDAAKAGAEMSTRGTLVEPSAVRHHPGLMRVRFNDALRSAQTRERAEQLLPLARALDEHFGGDSCQRAVREVMARNFSRRGPLAQLYPKLLDRTLDLAQTDAYLARLRAAGEEDLLLGALYLTGRHVQRLDEWSALARRTGEPWFTLFADTEVAREEFRSGKISQAQVRLTAALARCGQTSLRYRCARIEELLAEVYAAAHQPVPARDHALSALKQAQADNEVELETQCLQVLGEVARARNSFALTEAYLLETAKRQPGYCPAQGFAREQLATLRLFQMKPAEARQELDAVTGCASSPFSLVGALAVAELARMDGRPEDVARLEALLGTLRAEGRLSSGQALVARYAEGLALASRDPLRSRELLRQTISEAAALPGDTNAVKARAYSYAELELSAGKAGDFAGALDLFTEAAGAGPAGPCMLGAEVQLERSLVVARGADGKVVGTYEATPKVPASDFSGLVAGHLVEALRACPEVAVFARHPLHGRAELLPPELAWSFRVGREHPVSNARPRRLVISDVDAPKELELPRLKGWSTAVPPLGTVALSGPAATPSRVLEELKDATFVEIHAHGLVNPGLSDAALVVLSPEPGGRYALTATDVRQAKLSGAPVVLLAACQAAQTAPYLHESWSLPTAFVEAGARAVIAARSDIPDSSAATFFAAVDARIASGESPAVAVRNERRAALAQDSSHWSRAIVIFK